MRIEIDPAALEPVIKAAITAFQSESARLDHEKIAFGEDQAAKLLGVPASVLRNARADGELVASRLGRRVVYERGELLRWLVSRRE